MKTKRLFSVLILSALLPVAALADQYYDNENLLIYSYTVGESEASLVGYDGGLPFREDYELVIISHFTVDGNEYKVTSLPDRFLSGMKMTKVTIQEGITSIGNYFFSNCSKLSQVILPESLTSISNGLFYGCSSLTSITIPSSVTSIGDQAFDYCTSLTSITIPSGVTTIGGSAFSGCSSLASVTISEGVNEIGGRAFSGCSSLTSITIPSSVTTIGGSAFSGCSSLASVTISEGVNEIGSSAFNSCSNLTSITIPESITTVGQYAFDDCSNLTSITINCPEVGQWFSGSSIKEVIFGKNVKKVSNGVFPSTVSSITFYCTEIGSWFSYNNSIKEVILCEGVTSIKNSAFKGCRGLTNVTIPSSVTNIGYSVFSDCNGLECINVDEGNTVYDSRNNCNAIIETSTNTLIQGCQNTVIPNSVTSIGGGAFHGCSGLTSLTIPSSVTSIGSSAFGDCIGLTNISIPSGVTSIGRDAFFGCSGLIEITISSSVTSIGEDAFFRCSGLESIIVDRGNTVYDSRDNCNAIIETSTNTLIQGCQNTVIPISVTSIGDKAFYECSSMTSITIPSSVTSIGSSAFNSCSSLTSVSIPSSVTSIGDDTFHGCSSLASLISFIEEPFEIGEKALCLKYSYDWNTYEYVYEFPSTLYVPKGTKEKYEATPAWNKFQTIIEMDDETTAVDDAIAHSGKAVVTERYALGGQRIATQQQGLNIVRMSDGTVKKVVMK